MSHINPLNGEFDRWMRLEHAAGMQYLIKMPGLKNVFEMLYRIHLNTKSKYMLNKHDDSWPPCRQPDIVEKMVFDILIAAVVPVYSNFNS